MSSRKRGPRGTDWEQVARDMRRIIDGHEDELRDQLQAENPAFGDQLQAAVADARRKEARVSAFMRKSQGQRFADVPFSQVPEQLADRLSGLYIRVITELTTGDRTPCPHVRIDAPVPFIALVFGDRADCWPCTARRGPVRPVMTEREEHTCDLCGAWRPRQTMHQLSPRYGAVTIVAGACDGCMRVLRGEAPP